MRFVAFSISIACRLYVTLSVLTIKSESRILQAFAQFAPNLMQKKAAHWTAFYFS